MCVTLLRNAKSKKKKKLPYCFQMTQKTLRKSANQQLSLASCGPFPFSELVFPYGGNYTCLLHLKKQGNTVLRCWLSTEERKKKKKKNSTVKPKMTSALLCY